MDETVEKSCWGITLWAITIVLGLALIASFVMNADTRVAVDSLKSDVSVATVITR